MYVSYKWYSTIYVRTSNDILSHCRNSYLFFLSQVGKMRTQVCITVGLTMDTMGRFLILSNTSSESALRTHFFVGKGEIRPSVIFGFPTTLQTTHVTKMPRWESFAKLLWTSCPCVFQKLAFAESTNRINSHNIAEKESGIKITAPSTRMATHLNVDEACKNGRRKEHTIKINKEVPANDRRQPTNTLVLDHSIDSLCFCV